MSAPNAAARLVLPSGLRAAHLVERNLVLYRRTWMILFSGFFEPLIYLLGIGYGVGSLVGKVPGAAGHPVSYTVFVAPALMASSAMNGAIYETTFNLFHKLRYAKTFESILATPLNVADIALGEVAWALIRGTLYATAFCVVMVALHLVASPFTVLAVPAAVLIGFTFAGIGTAATTFVRKWEDFDLVQVVLLPLFLFSATFYPITVYPPPLRILVQLTPLYHGVHLLRGLTTGLLQPGLLLDVAYLAALGGLGLAVAGRRLQKLLLK